MTSYEAKVNKKHNKKYYCGHNMKMKEARILNFIAISDIFSLLNMICGLLSILSSFNQDYKLAAIFIIFAIMFDSIDGWVARLTNRDDELGFGKTIDSLSDVVSFAIAPAILFYTISIQNFSEIITIIVCIIMAVCGVLRLTRFNAISDYVDFDGFIGFPIPGIALILATYYLTGAYNPYIGTILMILASYLMTSSILYPKFNNIPLLIISVILIIFMIFPIVPLVYGIDIAAVFLLLITLYYLIINIFR